MLNNTAVNHFLKYGYRFKFPECSLESMEELLIKFPSQKLLLHSDAEGVWCIKILNHSLAASSGFVGFWMY
jgi:hypothetical protein